MIYRPDLQGKVVGEMAEAWTTGQEPQESADYKWASFGISQIDGTELCHFPLVGRGGGLD